MTWGGKGAHECSGFLGILYRKDELHNMSCSLETGNVRATYAVGSLGTAALVSVPLLGTHCLAYV